MAELFLDRFEDEVAVLTLHGRTIELPRALIPDGAREGEVLRLSLTRDPEATRKAQERVAGLRGKLGSDDDGGDVKL